MIQDTIIGIGIGLLFSVTMLVTYLCISDDPQDRIDECEDEIKRLGSEVLWLRELLIKIAGQATPNANATVKRMATMARQERKLK